MSLSTDNNTPKIKTTRIRSIAYPSYTLDSSIKFVTQINDAFSSHSFTPQEDISKTLGLSGGAFLQRLSTAVQYGLLQLKKGEGYKPTDTFSKINKPIPGENVDDTLIECLHTPELYKKIFNDFKDKQLPSDAGLINMLDRIYGVKGNGAKLAAKVFFSNIQSAKLVTEDDVLKISSYIPYIEVSDAEEIEKGSVVEKTGLRTPLLPNSKNIDESDFETSKNTTIVLKQNKEIPIFLQGQDREAKVLLPKDFSDNDLKRIVNVLNAYISE